MGPIRPRFRPRGVLVDLYVIDFVGRSGEIRTPDPLLPKQVRAHLKRRQQQVIQLQIKMVSSRRADGQAGAKELPWGKSDSYFNDIGVHSFILFGSPHKFPAKSAEFGALALTR